MALSTFLGLFKTKGAGVSTETPQFYLKLTKICTKQADSMVASSSLKFNHELCKYLADKLKVAVRSALSFFEPIASWYSKFASHEDRGRSLEIFKLLFALSKEVEAFIQGCSKDAWVQSAILLTNVSEHITSLGFDLEFCTIVFSSRKKYGSLPTWTVAEISRLRKAEADIVEEKSHLDQLRLYEDAKALLTRPRKPGIADEQQVMLLLERLRGRGLHVSADSPEPNHPSLLEKISMSSLKKVQVLGTGSFGDVWKAKWLGIEVARKTFHGPSAADFEREVEILEGLNHPNIVSLLWHTRDERNCHMIMEVMDGDLYSLMQDRLEECGSNGPPFSISEAVHIMLQVAEGMLFLLEKRIVHRDLKSRNILIKHMKATEVGIKYVHAKVADFGLSRTKEKSMTYSNQTLNQGTTRWMAPEMMKNGNEDDEVEVEGEEVLEYPFKVDVYSFGMVCFEILSGDVPFSSLTPKEVRRMVLGGERPQLPDVCPERLRCLIEACWRPEPNERPRFDDICAELRDLTCAHYMTSAWTTAPRCFSLEEIMRITNNFSVENYRGRGSFSEVYRGVIVDKAPSGAPTTEVVAVKRMKSSMSKHASDVFTVQMEVLPRLHHNNVVGSAGFCMELGEEILVFEYMKNGSLDKWLFDHERKGKLTWPVRRNICLGVANGIHYLHSVCQPRVVHGNIHSEHILLDQNLEAKLCGFSLAYLLTNDESDTAEERIIGTSGFRAPEYLRHGLVSQKVDVLSFGVVLLEIVSGRQSSLGFSDKKSEDSLRKWARRLHSEGRFEELIDRDLNLQPDEKIEVVRIIRIALLCSHRSPEIRPDMSLVVAMLQGIWVADNSRLFVEHLKNIEKILCSFSDFGIDRLSGGFGWYEAALTTAPRCFSLEEIMRITNNFSVENYSRPGCFSKVYRGVIVDKAPSGAPITEVVAVKRIKKPRSNDPIDVFRVQVEVLPRLHHNNVVGYAGFCMEMGQEILVFEYMKNGSLDKWLFDHERKGKLTWPVRRNICLGVANGIHYLHSLSQPRIVHRDIKSKHILLDQNLEAKLCGFSLAYLLTNDESDTAEERVIGTSRCRVPAYFRQGLVSQKVDVFSFGVVLLEIVSGRQCNLGFSDKKSEDSLPNWARILHSEGRIDELIDRTLNLQPDEKIEVVRIIGIVLLCSHDSPEIRPDMSLVVAMLQGILVADNSRLFLERLKSIEEMRF